MQTTSDIVCGFDHRERKKIIKKENESGEINKREHPLSLVDFDFAP